MESSKSPQQFTTAIQRNILSQAYDDAIKQCEQAVDQHPTIVEFYWYLGLVNLLQGDEENAHTTWLWSFTASDAEDLDVQFSEFLEISALEHEARKLYAQAWSIRRYTREINPANLDNWLAEIWLAAHLDKFASSVLNLEELAPILEAVEPHSINLKLLEELVFKLLEKEPQEKIVKKITLISYRLIGSEASFSDRLIVQCLSISNRLNGHHIAAQLLKAYCEQYPESYEPLLHLSSAYARTMQYGQGVEVAQNLYHIADGPIEQMAATYQILQNLLYQGGTWELAQEQMLTQDKLLNNLIANGLPPSKNTVSEAMALRGQALRLTIPTFFNAYLRDDLKINRYFQNGALDLCYQSIQAYKKLKKFDFLRSPQKILSQSKQKRKIKIGYISHCFRKHSVGWLARWLIQYHNRDCYEAYGYLMLPRDSDPLKDWYIQQFDHTRQFSSEEANDLGSVCQKIADDEIDILVDLDSTTLDLTCAVLSLKPAPLQVSWLGADAPGLPCVDYFIADPYVLPENAQEHYVEKIWRLPQTYIAVDGFEISTPTLRRDDLSIPEHSTIFFCGQAGFKRNPHITMLQMKILLAVPESHLLIAGLADLESLREHMYDIADGLGLNRDRLHFLSRMPTEVLYRANLSVIDVALDTYPYNGATTTLELLWTGVPLVTRVGEQFTARNSYTMMVNAGISEGIAWTDEEYVEWGIRLGTDETLRRKIHWKLMRSRQTAPLWNAKQFTRNMEAAYEEMWNIYCQ